MRLSPPQARLRSLDVFRGATIASMILVNTPGSLEASYPQLRHADWFGWTFADTIFPAFLWIIGVSMALSTATRLDRGDSRFALLKHAVHRSVVLFAIGVFLTAFVFPVREFPLFRFEHYLQLSGVLQKIAICYLVATAIFLTTGWRGVVASIVALSLMYLGLAYFYPVPNCDAGVWTIRCNFAAYVDHALLNGHLWRVPGKQDPDALGSLLPATTSVLYGVLAGYLLCVESDPRRRMKWMLISGYVLVPVGLVLSSWIPISKPLWTPSYAVLMAGLASWAMAFFIWVVDIRSVRWLKPLEIFGMNALAAYVVSVAGIHVAKLHVFGKSLYNDFCLAIADPANASLIYAAFHVLVVFVVVWWMYRHRWFLRF
jgi:predicted acyltransferase